MKVLLVQPRFPVPTKSLNHRDYLPVGLLKLAALHQAHGDDVALSLGDFRTDFIADEVYVTSLFTYWADHVRDAVLFYRECMPEARITVGGIYASLQPDHCREHTGCDAVWQGVHHAAERFQPDYSLVDTSFQIIHASRGCIRACNFCGTHQIEPDFEPKSSIAQEIVRNHLVFYDNNLLANPYIRTILGELARARVNSRVVTSESQSGFDGRVLHEQPDLATLLKAARFRNVRIAWDGGLREASSIHEQINLLVSAGFSRKEIQVFMLYNHRLRPSVLFQKVEQCFDWGVQVADCRYRPLDLYRDGYLPYRKSQSPDEYFIHDGWSDEAVRGLRRTVRANNICVRYVIPREHYNQRLEGLSAESKHQIARGLGIEARRYSQKQLDLIHLRWFQSRGPDADEEYPTLFEGLDPALSS